MKIHDPEWKVTVTLVRAAEELGVVQHKLWNDPDHFYQSCQQMEAYRAMAKARVALHEAAIKTMPPGGTFHDYTEIVLSIYTKGAPT